jgi:DNA topoisomerase II
MSVKAKTKTTTKPVTTSTAANSKLAQQYQRKTDKEHVLDNPDTYIGSVEKVDSEQWIMDPVTKKIILKTIEYVPGLYKLFDEGIVNCRDHVIRMIQSEASNKRLVSSIEIDVDDSTGMITLTNDGNGIDVAKHPVEDMWIPEMIFGHLRTSTNYDKTEKKIVGGKNGFGFKLVLIWSSWGYIETVDHNRGLKYCQTFHNNLETIDPPKITKCSKSKPYTKVSFIPDFKRLGLTTLSNDMKALFEKRAYDIAAVTDHSTKKVKFQYNSNVIPIKNFNQYLDFYIGPKEETKRIYESTSDRWEYAVCLNPKHEFGQVSFVNGICTHKGGKHVDYILGQIVRKLCAYIEKKKKVSVNQVTIKEQLLLFLRCDIENPSFDSQTKDYMNTPSSKFGSSCTVSDSFIEKVAKMGVMEMACQLTETKEAGRTKRKMDGSKTRAVRGIANFVDANYAGTDKSKQCVLILAEGLSAMSGIVSGLDTDDRNTIGIYPLKGKVLNVRGATRDLSENRELSDLIKILGLRINENYESMEDVNRNLRYSKIMIMSDQDLDGSHIKGLCINLFHALWPSLVKIDGFLCFMNTPILRAKKNNEVLRFYNEGEYQRWKETLENGSTKGWTLKYFKGLGTSTATEFKEYFANKKMVDFHHETEKSDNTIDMVFNKKRTEERKQWLEQYDKGAYLDTNNKCVSYDHFFHKEMVHFSVYDCERSIPNMVDGLKTSLRKILYCAFKRRLTQEIKVAQFSGYVSENSAYHHGEASLNGAIVNMAQNFVGSNNINLLVPNGQFGTRLKGGEDSASERYIFTYLNPITRALFPEADDLVLDYINDDGQIVEPTFYCPIIPFALCNGISGIGTGFSCNIPSYNPQQLIQYIRGLLKQDQTTLDSMDFKPYYEGFQGTVSMLEPNKYLIKGLYETINDNTIVIRELPIGTWTMNYISFLEDLLDNGLGGSSSKKKKGESIIKDFSNISTEMVVHITIVFEKNMKAKLESSVDTMGINGLEKALKLTTTVSTTNMNMFNHQKQLTKYKTVQDVIHDYYQVRLQMYEKRKAAQIDQMEHKVRELSNRALFIVEVVNNSIDLRKLDTDEEVNQCLQSKKYDMVNGKYDYLTHMPMHTMTKTRVQKLIAENEGLKKELEELRNRSISTIWLSELDQLEKEYHKYREGRIALLSTSSKKLSKGQLKKSGSKTTKSTKK